MSEEIPREMVLFPSYDQFNEKTNELMLDYEYEEEDYENYENMKTTECYWTIPFFPRNLHELIGTKIYFYDRWGNCISLRATITRFAEVELEERWKKAVFFRLVGDDLRFQLDLDELGYEKRKQFRGFCYRWWKEDSNEDM